MIFKDLKFGDISDFTSLIYVRVFAEKIEKRKGGKVSKKRIPRGFVFVRNPKEYGPNALWKIAGGGPENGEKPLDAAVRELLEETNIQVSAAECKFEGRWLGPAKDHWKCLFSVDVEEKRIASMNSMHPGNDGEIPKLFRMDKLIRTVAHGKFMRDHYAKLTELGLLLPGPEEERLLKAARP